MILDPGVLLFIPHSIMESANPNKKLRIIVFDFHSKMMTNVIKALQARSVEIIYWVAGKKDFMTEVFNNKAEFPRTIFHDADDAVAAIPASKIDTSLFNPLGKEFVKAFYECELRSLVMMEESDYTNMPLIKKVHLYHKYLAYWCGVLTALKPDAILYNDVPHMSYKYVAYHVAKYLGIKQIMLRNTQIGGRILLVDDIEDYKKLRTRLEINKNKNFAPNDLSPDVRDYYEKQRSIDAVPFYARAGHIKKRTRGLFRFLPSPWAVKKNLKNSTFLRTAYLYLRMLFMKRRLLSLETYQRPVWAIKLQERRWQHMKNGFKKEYIQYQTIPDYSKKYIYVPLQRQQEKSTSTDGDIFADQILMIDILSHAIPHDWVIYVKESPLQWVMPRSHVGRFKGYTKELVEMGNVRAVPTETSTFDLIKNSQVVAVVTGTAALEAVLRGKPAFVFGYTWFMYTEGIFRVHDIVSAKNAIKKIISGYAPDQREVINLLKALDETSIQGYRDRRFRDGDDLNIKFVKDDEENAKSIAAGLYKELFG